MPYFIDIECSNCHQRFKIDGANYANKKISFGCKNCGNKISYFVPPGYDGLSAPKSEISTTKVKKVKEPKKKEFKPDLMPSVGTDPLDTEGLKLKLPSIFRKRTDDKQTSAIADKQDINIPRAKMASREQAMPQNKKPEYKVTEIQSKLASPKSSEQQVTGSRQNIRTKDLREPVKEMQLSPKVANFEATGEAEIPEFLQNRAKISDQRSAAQISLNSDIDKSMVHIPKPGMPFIAQISTPSFYKAGSYKRKDYSFIITELSKFRNIFSKQVKPESVSAYQAAISSPIENDIPEEDSLSQVEEGGQISIVSPIVEPIEDLPLQQPEIFIPPFIPEPKHQPINIAGNQATEQPAVQKPVQIIPELNLSPISEFKEEIPSEMKSPVRESEKIFIPLQVNQQKETTNYSSIPIESVIPAIEISTEDESWSVSEVEIIEDNQFTSVMQPAPSIPVIPDERTKIEIGNFPSPATGAAYHKDSAAVLDSSQEGTATVVMPRPMPQQSQSNTQRVIESPVSSGFDPNAMNIPQTPMFHPIQPQQVNPPIPVFNPNVNPQSPPAMQTGVPSQVPVPFSQPQPYGMPQGFTGQNIPVIQPEQAVTQRMPSYPNIQNPQRPAVMPQTPFQQPTFQEPASMPHFQPQTNIPAPPSIRPDQIRPQQYQPAQPSRPVTANEIFPNAQKQAEPARPVPPPSVTSPVITGSVKKPKIEEDEEEQFGPSNFGLDF